MRAVVTALLGPSLLIWNTEANFMLMKLAEWVAMRYWLFKRIRTELSI